MCAGGSGYRVACLVITDLQVLIFLCRCGALKAVTADYSCFATILSIFTVLFVMKLLKIRNFDTYYVNKNRKSENT